MIIPYSLRRSAITKETARPPGWTILSPSSIWSSGKSVTHSRTLIIAFHLFDRLICDARATAYLLT